MIVVELPWQLDEIVARAGYKSIWFMKLFFKLDSTKRFSSLLKTGLKRLNKKTKLCKKLKNTKNKLKTKKFLKSWKELYRTVLVVFSF